MKRIAPSALVAALASAALAAPASAAPAAPNAAQACKAGATLPWGEPFPSKSSCITFLSTGKLVGTSYVAQCRAITGGRYPFTFYGTTTVTNAGQCLNVLRSFGHEAPPQG